MKAYRRSRALRASRDGLRHVLKVAPELHRLQPLENLLRGTWLQIQGLLGLSGAFVAAELSGNAAGETQSNIGDDNFIATLEHDAFNLQIGTGRFEHKRWPDLGPEIQTAVRTAVQTGKTQCDQVLTIPLMVGLRLVGVIFCERAFLPETELELLEMFASQVAVAIENVQTFEGVKSEHARA